MNIGTVVEELRASTEALRAAGVTRAEFSEGRAVLAGDGFALLLGDTDAVTGIGLPIAPPPMRALPEPEAEPKAMKRVPEPVGEERLCGFEREDGATCGRMRTDRGHTGRHGSWSDSRAERVSRRAEEIATERRTQPATGKSRSAKRGGAADVTVDGRLAAPTNAPDQRVIVAPKSPAEKCPKCGRFASWDLLARDEFGNDDPHCAACGVRPTRLPTPDESEPAEGKQRRREPSFNGMRL